MIFLLAAIAVIKLLASVIILFTVPPLTDLGMNVGLVADAAVYEEATIKAVRMEPAYAEGIWPVQTMFQYPPQFLLMYLPFLSLPMSLALWSMVQMLCALVAYWVVWPEVFKLYDLPEPALWQ